MQFPAIWSEGRSPIASEEHERLTHALKNKLGIILTRCELMSRRMGLDAKASEDLRTIRAAADAMAEMLTER